MADDDVRPAGRGVTAKDCGFVPGNYFCRCSTCGGEFEGDKRAWACESCATFKAAAMNASASEPREARTHPAQSTRGKEP
jgi:hypothetical protein